MSGSRREFLRSAAALAAASLIFGFDGLLRAGQEGGSKTANAGLPDALRLMKQRKHDGVVFRIPDTEADRAELARNLQELLENFESTFAQKGDLDWAGRSDLALTFGEAVYACAPAKGLAFEDGENVLLLDPEGKKLAGATVELGDPKKALTGLRALLDRQPFADARHKRLDPEAVRVAREYVRSESMVMEIRERPRELARILLAAPALIPEARKDTESSLAIHLAVALGAGFAGAAEEEGVETALFGVEWNYESYDYCPTCGMMFVPASAREFVRFLLEE